MIITMLKKVTTTVISIGFRPYIQKDVPCNPSDYMNKELWNILHGSNCGMIYRKSKMCFRILNLANGGKTKLSPF